MTWLLVAVLVWVLVAVALSLLVARFFQISESSLAEADDEALARAASVPRPAPVAAPSSPVPAREPLRSRRILIVDDDAALRTLLHTTLSAEFEVAEAESARHAFDLARFWRPTVVLLDVAMPGMDGLSFCAELKRKQASEAPLVVLLTGAEIGQEEAVRAQADALLRKPFSPLELLGVIDRLTGVEGVGTATELADEAGDQVLLYARDLSRLVEIERMQ